MGAAKNSPALLGERIAIHAAKRKPTEDDLGILNYANKLLVGFRYHYGGKVSLGPEAPMGMVVATAVLSEAVNVYRVIDGMACWADKGLRRAVPRTPLTPMATSPRAAGFGSWRTSTSFLNPYPPLGTRAFGTGLPNW